MNYLNSNKGKYRNDNRPKKEILFLDGDGTVWYPKSTKRTKNPHWIYKSYGKTGYLDDLVVIPGTLAVLRKLKSQGVIIILLSTHPYPKRESIRLLEQKIKYLNLGKYIDEYYPTPDRPEAKGELLIKILNKWSISKNKALMVGDSYLYDFCSAKNVGVEAFLLETNYTFYPKGARRVSRGIKHLRDIVDSF